VVVAVATSVAALLGTIRSAHASTIVVDSLANLDPDVLTAQMPTKCPLRWAIQAANTNQPVYGCKAGEPFKTNVIQFSPALFNDGTRNPKVFTFAAPPGVQPWFQTSVTQPFIITSPMEIQGPGPDLLVLDLTPQGTDPTQPYEAFIISAVNAMGVKISGLTIRGGRAVPGTQGASYGVGGGTFQPLVPYVSDNGGAGMRIIGMADVTLDNMRFLDNYAQYSGGAIESSATGVLTITNSTFANNSAGGGGGGAIALEGNVHRPFINIDHCTFENNTAQYNVSIGGAISNSWVITTITNSTFTGNAAKAGFFGGGYSSGQGGAIDAENSSQVLLKNVTLANNTAGRSGGALHVGVGATFSLVNVTVANNTATNESGSDGKAGGLHVDVQGSANMVNTLFTGNQRYVAGVPRPSPTGRGTIPTIAQMPSDCAGGFLSHGFNLFDSTSGCTGFISTDIVNRPAGVAALAFNGGPTETIALLRGSPAIDAGTPTGAPATDQRGVARNAHPDIGAYEYSLVRMPTGGPAPGTVVNTPPPGVILPH
jgi:predicted outer membrane repeat protein